MPRHNGGQSVGGGTGRKHHKKKRGITTKSRYPSRLSARGISSKSVHMKSLETLRYAQRWMLPYVSNGVAGGHLFGALATPIPARKPESDSNKIVSQGVTEVSPSDPVAVGASSEPHGPNEDLLTAIFASVDVTE